MDFMTLVFVGAPVLVAVILLIVSGFHNKKAKDNNSMCGVSSNGDNQGNTTSSEKQLENNRKAEIKETTENADKLGYTFGVLILVVAALCFFGALLNAVFALGGDDKSWMYAGICLGCCIAMVFFYWMITIFSRIYITLVSIDKKLDDLRDK